MNIRTVVVALLIGMMLSQAEASRSKSSRKKAKVQNEDTELAKPSELSGTKKEKDEDNAHKNDKEHEHTREHKIGEKKGDKKSSSSSEEDDKEKNDAKNKTVANMDDKVMHRAKRTQTDEQVEKKTEDQTRPRLPRSYIVEGEEVPWIHRYARFGHAANPENWIKAKRGHVHELKRSQELNDGKQKPLKANTPAPEHRTPEGN